MLKKASSKAPNSNLISTLPTSLQATASSSGSASKEPKKEGSKKVKLESGVMKGLIGKDGKMNQTMLRKLFRSCDQDKNGTLDKEEATAFFERLYEFIYEKTPISQRPELNFMLETWFILFDADGGGTISWEEFVVEMEKLLIPDKAETLFGKPLADVAKDLSGGFVPNLLYLCLNYIYEKGMKEEGILRLCGSSQVVKMMQQEADIARKFTIEMLESRLSIMEFHHCVSSFMKLYVRSLPGSIISEEVFSALQTKQRELDVQLVRKQIEVLGKDERHVLYSISLLCTHIIKEAEANKMTTQACGVCWGGSVCTSYRAQTLEGTCFAAQLMEFLIKNHHEIFNANDYIDVFSKNSANASPQESVESAVFTVNFDFGHKKVPFAATEPLSTVIERICMARGIDANDYFSTDMDGNPLALTLTMAEVKGAAMKFVTKDIDKVSSVAVTSPARRPSRPVARPPHWDNRNMKLLPPKYQNTLAHSNVDMERVNNDDAYREIVMSVLTVAEEEGIEIDESGVQSLDPTVNLEFDNMLLTLACSKEVAADFKQLKDESKQVLIELFRKANK